MKVHSRSPIPFGGCSNSGTHDRRRITLKASLFPRAVIARCGSSTRNTNIRSQTYPASPGSARRLPPSRLPPVKSVCLRVPIVSIGRPLRVPAVQDGPQHSGLVLPKPLPSCDGSIPCGLPCPEDQQDAIRYPADDASIAHLEERGGGVA